MGPSTNDGPQKGDFSKPTVAPAAVDVVIDVVAVDGRVAVDDDGDVVAAVAVDDEDNALANTGVAVDVVEATVVDDTLLEAVVSDDAHEQHDVREGVDATAISTGRRGSASGITGSARNSSTTYR